MRVDTQTILSIHHNLITQNHRISLTHNDHRSWYLHIKEVEEDDRGWYMCQINTGESSICIDFGGDLALCLDHIFHFLFTSKTDPMRSRKGYLQVVGMYQTLFVCVCVCH